MLAVAKKNSRKKSNNPPSKAPWLSPPEPMDDGTPKRGPGAVQHGDLTRGRRSRIFPDVNITATALGLGVTKAHLAKVLSGQTRPSIELAKKLRDALGVSLDVIVALYDTKEDGKHKPQTKKAKRR